MAEKPIVMTWAEYCLWARDHSSTSDFPGNSAGVIIKLPPGTTATTTDAALNPRRGGDDAVS